MRNSVKLILTVLFTAFVSSSCLAQDLNGNYTASGVGEISIANNKMIVTKSIYEFYGKPNTIYKYTYRLTRSDDKHLTLKLRKSRITDGPKRLKGSGRVWAKSRAPKIDGTYEIEVIGNDIVLKNNDTSEKITLKKKST